MQPGLILALPLPSSIALSKSLNLSVPQLLHLYNGPSRSCQPRAVRLAGLIHVAPPAQCLAHSKWVLGVGVEWLPPASLCTDVIGGHPDTSR